MKKLLFTSICIFAINLCFSQTGNYNAFDDIHYVGHYQNDTIIMEVVPSDKVWEINMLCKKCKVMTNDFLLQSALNDSSIFHLQIFDLLKNRQKDKSIFVSPPIFFQSETLVVFTIPKGEGLIYIEY